MSAAERQSQEGMVSGGLRWRRFAWRHGRSWLPRVVAFSAVAWIPPMHIAFLVHFWKRYTRAVNKRHCSCSCWDTVFKGPYEQGIAEYKHFYFNATEDFLKIWLIVVVFLVLLYECLLRLATLAVAGRLRWEMLLLFAGSMYSHYYSWWAYINYYNDEFYAQWYHQLFFTVTELASTVVIMHLADEENSVTLEKVLVVIGIALLHLVAGGWDQFYSNILRGEGMPHQVVRDFCLMIPDFLNTTVPAISLVYWSRKPIRLTHNVLLELGLTLVFVVVGFWIVSSL